MSDRAGLLLMLSIAGLTVAGCGPSAQVVLNQPQYAGAQRHLRLQSDQVYWSSAEGIDRYLMEFPLPGASTGRAMYLVYMQAPTTDPRQQVRPEPREGPPVRGFIIQTRGENAGLELITSGQVVLLSGGAASEGVRELRVELIGERQSQLIGVIKATHNDNYIGSFETRRRPADVQALDEMTATQTVPTTQSAP